MSNKAETYVGPSVRYNNNLMKAILSDKVKIAEVVNATVISLGDAPKGN